MKLDDHTQWALITGASSGIGEALARRFAKGGWNVILVARSVDKLNALAHELSAAHGVKTLVIGADLRVVTACRDIVEKIKAADVTLDCLVNNAGFGAVGAFEEISLLKQLEMIDVNVKALLELTHLFLPEMIQRKHGFIINVSSTAGFQPVPYLATYAATKAFVTIFSESLWAECKGSGVQVMNLCPGRTSHTNFSVVSGKKENQNDWRPKQTAEEVADMAFRQMGKNRPTLSTNPCDNFLRFASRFVSRKCVALIAGKLSKRVGYH